MPRPTSSTTVSRPDLGALAFEYALQQSQSEFIGTRVMPVFETAEQSGEYPVIPVEAILKQQTTRRAPRSAYNRSDWEFENDTFDCVEYGWEEPIDDVEAALYSRFFDAEEVAVLRAVDIIMRGHEQRVADTVFDTNNAIGNAGVTNEWDDAANATPRADVIAGKQAMRAASGLMPNALVISSTVFDNVLATDELKNYLQYTTPHLVEGMDAQRATLARYFGLDEVLVGTAVKDTAAKGKAASIGDIWDDEYAALVRIPRQPRNLREPSFGRTMLWTADSPSIITTETYRDEPHRADVYRVRQNVDEVVIFEGGLYLLTNITA